jgi:hypothetical protein
MKAIIYLPVLFACLTISSCNYLSFKQPQPSWINKNEKTFPKEYCGYYLIDGAPSAGNVPDSSTPDSLKITPYRLQFLSGKSAGNNGNNNPDPQDGFSLSDSVILRKYAGNYFLNIEDESLHTWQVVRLKKDGPDLGIYMLLDSSGDLTHLIGSLRAITLVSKMSTDTSQYVIDPSETEFKEILAHKMFVKTFSYHKIIIGNGAK